MNAEAVKAYAPCISLQMLWKERVLLILKPSGRPLLKLITEALRKCMLRK